MPFYTFGIQEQNITFPFFSEKFVLQKAKNALQTSENVRKSALLKPVVADHRVQVHTFGTCHFTHLGLKNKTYFANFLSDIFGSQTCTLKTENFLKSAQLKPAVGHNRIEVQAFDASHFTHLDLYCF